MKSSGRFSVEGKRAVVTGGGGGLGRSFCLILAEAGAEVVVVDILGVTAEETVDLVVEAGGYAEAIECDVSNETDVSRMDRRIADSGSPVNILVNNAGISTPSRRVADIPVNEWDEVLSVNLRSAFLCSRALIPSMLRTEYPTIVNVASILGVRAIDPGIISQAGYAASKAGMIALTLQTAADYGSDGLRANAIAPGWHFGTDLGKRVGNFTTPEEDERLHRRVNRRTPLGRGSNAEELAPLVLYLASDASRFVTGQVISHDGGWTAL